MKKKLSITILAMFLVIGTVLSGCGTDSTKEQKPAEQTNQEQKVEKEQKAVADVFTEAVDELNKAKEGQKVDYDKVIDLYKNNLQSLVQARDGEFNETADQQITAALEAGKNGSMDGVVVKQIFDKVMQKNFFYTVRHEFNEITENWDNKEKVQEEIKEAKEFYAILKPTVEKRDTAYNTTLVAKIDGGFAEIEKAVNANDQLGFQLGKQVVDKTLMKTFYLATGAKPNGYATKIEKESDPKNAKVMQAEGWGFYQSVNSYIEKNAKEESVILQKQFDLATDVKSVKAEVVNDAYVRAFAKIAIHEYEESQENWGKDKAVITALEGALFIDMIDTDLKEILGEKGLTTLNEQATNYYEAVKAKDKTKADSILKSIEQTLNQAIAKSNK